MHWGDAQLEKVPVYREPKATKSSKRSRRLIFLIFLFFITILIILFFDSSLSKITSIEVQGNHHIDSETIKRISGVNELDQYFMVFTGKVTERIEELPEIKQVDVSKTFPGRLLIQVEEYKEVALEMTANGTLHVVLENGVNVPLPSTGAKINLPILRNWEADPDLRLKLCRTLAQIELEDLADVSEIHSFPSVSYPDRVKLYTRSQFEVVTNIDYMVEKMPLLGNIIFKMQEQGTTSGKITMLEGNSGESFDTSMEILEE